MTEIEKMFENAGIKGEWRDYRTKNGKIYEGKNPKNRNIRLCKPRFTAEKQLEITKFLLKKAVYYDVKDDKYWFFWEECESAGYKPFDEAIAHFVNKIWQDLTNQEKEEIRNILNA